VKGAIVTNVRGLSMKVIGAHLKLRMKMNERVRRGENNEERTLSTVHSLKKSAIISFVLVPHLLLDNLCCSILIIFGEI
jgi:hypothetical protein